MVIISGMVCIYYNIIITWTFYYMFQSMQRVLPWSVCGQMWNSDNCVVERSEMMDDITGVNGSMTNLTYLVNTTAANLTTAIKSNGTAVPASEEFWE